VKILVADDQLLWRTRLSEILPSQGYQVHCVENGAQACALLGRDPDVDILLTDWVMPQMDGIELCRRVRRMDRERYLPIILLTSRSGRGDLSEALNAGADAFVRKPFEEAELLAQIRVAERILHLEERLGSRIRALAAAKSRLDRDLADAAAIQHSLLPPAPPRVAGVEFAWCYRACKQVGGDMFNVFQLDRDRIGVYVLDVSGHGTSAALHSVSLSRVLTPHPDEGGILMRRPAADAPESVVPPCQVAAELNRRYPLIEQSGQYFTLLYGILERPSLRFRYVRAGHPGPLSLAAGDAYWHESGGGVPIGVIEDAQYAEEEIQLGHGQGLLLFTDGVDETRNERGEQFGMQRLRAVAARCGAADIRRTVNTVHQQLEEFRKLEPQRDDLTLVGLGLR
jgi:sigma-B regulation protein RsbU (phosphoserine phosphatase)